VTRQIILLKYTTLPFNRLGGHEINQTCFFVVICCLFSFSKCWVHCHLTEIHISCRLDKLFISRKMQSLELITQSFARTLLRLPLIVCYVVNCVWQQIRLKLKGFLSNQYKIMSDSLCWVLGPYREWWLSPCCLWDIPLLPFHCWRFQRCAGVPGNFSKSCFRL